MSQANKGDTNFFFATFAYVIVSSHVNCFIKSLIFLILATLLSFRSASYLVSETFIYFENVFRKRNTFSDLVTSSYLSLFFSTSMKLLIQ